MILVMRKGGGGNEDGGGKWLKELWEKVIDNVDEGGRDW